MTSPKTSQQIERHLKATRQRLWDKPAGSIIKLSDFRLRITDGPNAYMQYKDIFIRGIYRFESDCPDPTVIDGGGNMGIASLGFRQQHPQCRLTVFEPDPAVEAMLSENLSRNKIEGVTVITAGLAATDGTTTFAPDGSAGGRVDNDAAGTTVKIVRLSTYVADSIDFLKLNIEGEELAVLQELESAGRIRNVQKMVVEYHGWATGPQRLGALLDLLDRNGFRYFVHDFDNETCTVTKPPFRRRPRADWFCLVFAQRVDS